MRFAVVRVVMIALIVTCSAAMLVTTEAAQCGPARRFASAHTGSFQDNVRIIPGSAENAGNEIGRFWQSSNSYLGNNFSGECPSTNGLSTWWETTAAGNRRIRGALGSGSPDGTVCDSTSCPIGDVTLIVEEMSTDGEDALFIGFRVDETPALQRWWDYSRVDPSPSPSDLPMLSYPSPEIVSSSVLPSGNIQLELLLQDVAPNVHSANGADDDPLPASSIVRSYDLYLYNGQGVPGRHVVNWTLIERVPYEDGPGSASVEVSCENDVQIAVGLSFNGGTGPDVVSSFVGRGLPIDCGQSPVTADAGEDRTAECAGSEGTPVTLDGSGTAGADEVEWTADGIVFDDPYSLTPTGLFPVGMTEVTLTAFADPYVDADTAQVAILDDTEPFLSCGLNSAGGGMGGDDEDDDSLLLAITLVAEDLCCGETEVDAAIDLGWVRLPVVDGEIIGLNCSGSTDDEGDDCGSVGNCGGHLRIQSTDATLRGVAIDCNGNVATCAVDLCEFPSGGSQKAVETTPRPGSGRVVFGRSE